MDNWSVPFHGKFEVEHRFNHLDARWQALKDRTDANALGAPQAVTTFPPTPKGNAGFSVTSLSLCVKCSVVRCRAREIIVEDPATEPRAYLSAWNSEIIAELPYVCVVLKSLIPTSICLYVHPYTCAHTGRSIPSPWELYPLSHTTNLPEEKQHFCSR